MLLFFWICLAIVIYAYIGYPLLICILSKVHDKPVNKNISRDNLPKVSVVIAALNEEANVVKRLDNIFEQNYPVDLIEVIVVSDGSEDNTNELVNAKISDFLKNDSFGQLKRPSLKLISYLPSRGKPYALNNGVKASTGEIIVFADCRQKFSDYAILNLVSNFTDSTIGCVSGELIFYNESKSKIKAEMGVYWKYEKWIRKMESKTGSVVGATGAIYAIRKELYRELPESTLLDDVLTPMNIIMQGSRVVFDGGATAYDVMAEDAGQEWKRKVRTLTGNWQLLVLAPELFLLNKNPIWWRFMSHKFSRLMVPFALPFILVSCLQLEGGFYSFFALLQILFYILAISASLSSHLRKIRVVNLAYFFCVLNLAAFWGFCKFISGQSNRAWTPTEYKRD